ncbi:hypothetical protein JD969_08815 [Planctomycetota bacterium]|nr:hypothetical protein JD969_08815 [Planctomycetota bacterium]
MISKWLSVEHAASALGVSASTVRRRISGNLVEWRQGEGNRREVKVYFEEGTEDQLGLGLILEVSQTPIEKRSAVSEHIEAAPQQNRMRPVSRNAKPVAAEVETEEQFESRPAEQSAAQNVLGGQKYSPLPSEAVGTPEDDDDAEPWNEIPQGQTEAERWPMGRPGFLKPSHLLEDQEEEEDVSPEAQARRFQKLAGASVLLAQKQADEANEKIAILHNHIYRMRQMCYLAWASAAVIAVASIGGITFSNGTSSGPAPAMAAPAATVNTPMDIDSNEMPQEEFGANAGFSLEDQLANPNSVTARTDFDQFMQMDKPNVKPHQLQNENDKLRDQLKAMQDKVSKLEAKSAKARKALQQAFDEDINVRF